MALGWGKVRVMTLAAWLPWSQDNLQVPKSLNQISHSRHASSLRSCHQSYQYLGHFVDVTLQCIKYYT
jgi:hypothetical protein